MGDDINKYMSVEVRDPDLCPRYTARLVRNIKIEPSPAWMRERLHASGVRLINKYRRHHQPRHALSMASSMHAFDYSRLSDGKIVAAARERRVHPDAGRRDHDLTDKMLAIPDNDKPVAVAGRYGRREPGEIEDDTRTVVFESACFTARIPSA